MLVLEIVAGIISASLFLVYWRHMLFPAGVMLGVLFVVSGPFTALMTALCAVGIVAHLHHRSRQDEELATQEAEAS